MRIIDADKFKEQVAVQAVTNKIPVEKANMICKIIDKQPTIVDINTIINELKQTMESKTQFEQGFHSALDEIEQSLSGLVN